MSDRFVRNVIEAAMLAAGRPVAVGELLELFVPHDRPELAEIHGALAALATEYQDRGLELKETASGWRVQIRREYAGEVSRLWSERPQRYSRALLETLALIAYRQPITRAEIEAVRGVAVNPNILRTLLERGWVRVVGHRDVPGHPELLGTTREFLDYFGLRTLDELPPLAELRMMTDIDPQLSLPAEGEALSSAPLPEVPVDAAPDGAAGGETMSEDESAEDEEAQTGPDAAASLVAARAADD